MLNTNSVLMRFYSLMWLWFSRYMENHGRSDSTTSRILEARQLSVLKTAHQFTRPSNSGNSTPVWWWMVHGSCTSNLTTKDTSISWNVESTPTIQTGAPTPLLQDPSEWSQNSRTAATEQGSAAEGRVSKINKILEFERLIQLQDSVLEHCLFQKC